MHCSGDEFIFCSCIIGVQKFALDSPNHETNRLFLWSMKTNMYSMQDGCEFYQNLTLPARQSPTISCTSWNRKYSFELKSNYKSL